MTDRPVVSLPAPVIVVLALIGGRLWIAGFEWVFGGAL